MFSKLDNTGRLARNGHFAKQVETPALIAFFISLVILAAACSQQPAIPPSQQNDLSDFTSPFGGSFENGSSRAQVLANIGLGSAADLGTSRNLSEINVDVSSVTPSSQRYTFLIKRGEAQVRIADPDSVASIRKPGDLLTTLTIEVIDPAQFSASASASSLLGFTIDYNNNALRIVHDNGIEVPSRSEGPLIASAQAEGSGVLATLLVEAVEPDGSEGAESQDGPEDNETYANRDRHETLIDLSGEPEGGTVKINIRIQETEPPVAALSPLEEDTSGRDTREDPPQPEESENSQNAGQNNQDNDPQPNSGQQNPSSTSTNDQVTDSSGNVGQDNPSNPGGDPSPKEGQQSEEETQPEDDPQDQIANKGSGDGDAFFKNFDVVFLIDNSTSITPRDRNNFKDLAVRAYLSSLVPGDQVGFVHFHTARAVTDLTPVPNEARVNPRGKKQDLIDILEGNSTIPGQGLTEPGVAYRRACEQLEELGRSPNRIAIALTDGEEGRSTIVRDPFECFHENGWPIYTVGIGAVDERVLKEIAEKSGGQYIPAYNPETSFVIPEIVCELQRVRSIAVGVLAPICQSRDIRPGSNVSFSSVVPQGQSQATFLIGWTGTNRLRLQIVTPSGDVFIPSVYFAKDMRGVWDGNTKRLAEDEDEEVLFEIMTVFNPEPGRWQVRLYQPEILPAGQEIVYGFTSLPDLR